MRLLSKSLIGLGPATSEEYPNGVRKITYRAADGNEIGFGGGPQ